MDPLNGWSFAFTLPDPLNTSWLMFFVLDRTRALAEFRGTRISLCAQVWRRALNKSHRPVSEFPRFPSL